MSIALRWRGTSAQAKLGARTKTRLRVGAAGEAVQWPLMSITVSRATGSWVHTAILAAQQNMSRILTTTPFGATLQSPASTGSSSIPATDSFLGDSSRTIPCVNMQRPRMSRRSDSRHDCEATGNDQG